MISYIPTWTRLIFYKAVLNIFTDGLEPKGISKFCYLDKYKQGFWIFVDSLTVLRERIYQK